MKFKDRYEKISTKPTEDEKTLETKYDDEINKKYLKETFKKDNVFGDRRFVYDYKNYFINSVVLLHDEDIPAINNGLMNGVATQYTIIRTGEIQPFIKNCDYAKCLIGEYIDDPEYGMDTLEIKEKIAILSKVKTQDETRNLIGIMDERDSNYIQSATDNDTNIAIFKASLYSNEFKNGVSFNATQSGLINNQAGIFGYVPTEKKNLNVEVIKGIKDTLAITETKRTIENILYYYNANGDLVDKFLQTNTKNDHFASVPQIVKIDEDADLSKGFNLQSLCDEDCCL